MFNLSNVLIKLFKKIDNFCKLSIYNLSTSDFSLAISTPYQILVYQQYCPPKDFGTTLIPAAII